MSEKTQNCFFNATVGYSENQKYPVRAQYQSAVLKHIIGYIEGRGVEVIPEIYEGYLKVSPGSERAFLHFFCPGWIRIKEANSVISKGTTGLSTWPAARVLAEYCVKNRGLFTGKTVLELGCGTGLVGLAVLKTAQPVAYVFSDCHASVLNLAQDNARLNGLGSYRVINLPWEEASPEILEEIDVILGADVVYDQTAIPGLVSVLRESNQNRYVRVIIACAVRNSETFGAFEDCVKGSGGELRDLEVPVGETFFAFADVPLRIFEIHFTNGARW